MAAAKLDIPRSFEMLYQNDIWICDTGASSHSTNKKTGAENEKESRSASLGHAGEALEATSTIDLPGQFMTKDGSSGLKASLTEVNYNDRHNFNLISLTRLLSRGWEIIKGNHTGITIRNGGGGVIDFDIVIPTARGAVFACRFVRAAEVSAVSTEAGTKMNINKAHGLLGHGNEDSTRLTAGQLGWTITRGTLRPCKHCAKAKVKQKNVCKQSTTEKAKKPGGRVYLDLSKVSVSKADGSEFELAQKNWKSIVDEATGMKWCNFTTTKSGMVERTCEWLNQMKARNIPVLIVRMDPGGENIKLEKRAKSVDWQSLQPIDFEMTSRDTPQHNNLAELSFPYLAGRARAMMGAANIPVDTHGKVAIEAIKLATMLDGLAIVVYGGKSDTRYVHVHGKNPRWARNLHVFGEAGVVKEGKDGKTGDRGQTLMFVGYPFNRELDSVRMWNPDTNRVITSRDILWMKRMFYEKLTSTAGTAALDDTALTEDAVDDETDSNPYEALAESDSDDESGTQAPAAAETVVSATVRIAEEAVVPVPQTTRSGRVIKPVDRLIESMTTSIGEYRGTNAALKFLESISDHSQYDAAAAELALVGAGIGGGYENTSELRVMNYKEAMSSKDAAGWKVEVGEEKKRFDKFDVFTPIKKSLLPRNAKIMTTTWAMKQKANGTKRGRLNARGYEQIEGTHYVADSIAAPVTTPTTIRAVLTLLAMNPKWISRLIDVEGAFLQGKFLNGEVLYIRVPDGFEQFYPPDVVLQLNVPIYGTKQAAACFYKALVEKVKDRKYERSKAEPCLYFIWNNNRLSLMVSWVDDIMALGHPEDVKVIEADMMEAFKCKSEGELKEYVGSKIDIKRLPSGLATVKFTNPVLIQKLQDEYEIPTGRPSKTPAVAGQVLVKGDGSGMIDGKQHKIYRSGTATCMYIMQWSRPDIYNTTRGLSRHMCAPRLAHEKAMHHLFRHVIATKNRGLVLAPDTIWDGNKDFEFRIHGRSDSDYAANTDDRRSVSGGWVFFE